MADELTNCEKLDEKRMREDDPVEAMERLIGIDPPRKRLNEKGPKWAVGERLQVIEGHRMLSGRILELDVHPNSFKGSFAKILCDSPALPAPEVWVSLRLAILIQ